MKRWRGGEDGTERWTESFTSWIFMERRKARKRYFRLNNSLINSPVKHGSWNLIVTINRSFLFLFNNDWWSFLSFWESFWETKRKFVFIFTNDKIRNKIFLDPKFHFREFKRLDILKRKKSHYSLLLFKWEKKKKKKKKINSCTNRMAWRGWTRRLRINQS